jgi:glycosyltransferase involved in cell wall biosynthesis
VDFHLKRHAFSRWKYKHVEVFLAASHVIASMLQQDGITPDRIETVHDGVPISYIDKQPPVDVHATFWLPHGAPVVGNIAALAAHKGQKHLVAAAKRVVRELPDTRFLIVGDGELREALERQIKELGLERHVLLTGFRPDALGLMKSLDLFVMSSVTEGLGSAVLEAMACRIPIVGTRAGGIPEAIVDGQSGVLVPPHDDEALATAMLRVLRDRELAARLAEGGRARVEDAFSVDRLVSETVRVYSERLAQM